MINQRSGIETTPYAFRDQAHLPATYYRRRDEKCSLPTDSINEGMTVVEAETFLNDIGRLCMRKKTKKKKKKEKKW